MSFDVNKFVAQTNQTGLAKENNFYVIVNLPAKFSESNLSRELVFRMDTASMPGRSIQTIDNRHYGPLRRIGHLPTHLEVGTSIILSEDMREKVFFEQWQDLISGDYRAQESKSPEKHSNIGYYDDYVGTVEIVQFNEKSQETHVVKLIEAYPYQVQPLNLSWASEEFHRLNVSFSYRYYTDKTKEYDKGERMRTDSLLTRLNKAGVGGLIGTAAGVLSGRVGPNVTAAAGAANKVLSAIYK